jgi:hypothetical protein
MGALLVHAERNKRINAKKIVAIFFISLLLNENILRAQFDNFEPIVGGTISREHVFIFFVCWKLPLSMQ